MYGEYGTSRGILSGEGSSQVFGSMGNSPLWFYFGKSRGGLSKHTHFARTSAAIISTPAGETGGLK
jgi:hypothetical protein